jgi:hypothetical protein
MYAVVEIGQWNKAVPEGKSKVLPLR